MFPGPAEAEIDEQSQGNQRAKERNVCAGADQDHLGAEGGWADGRIDLQLPYQLRVVALIQLSSPGRPGS